MTAEQVKAQLTAGGRSLGVVYSPEGDGREPGRRHVGLKGVRKEEMETRYSVDTLKQYFR